MTLFKDKMKLNRPRSIAILLLLPILLNCTLQETKKQHERLDSGKALVDHLDGLFASLQNKKTTDSDFQESVVTINENIRQTIERNIKSPQLLKEIQTYFPTKKHDFSFILSDDEKFGVFSWATRKKEFPIKNIAFYVRADRFAPSSLYGDPSIYDQLDVIHDGSGVPTYILGGSKNTSTIAHQYQLSAYVIRKDGIEESYIFPNGESSIAIRCNEQNHEACLAIENGKSLPKTMYAAIAQQPLTSEDGEYIFE